MRTTEEIINHPVNKAICMRQRQLKIDKFIFKLRVERKCKEINDLYNIIKEKEKNHEKDNIERRD